MTEVVAALIWDDDKFMICQRPAHKARGLLWEFVGGKVEPGETKEQALIRECQEELAVTLSVGDVFMDVIHEYPDLTVHLTLYSAVIEKGEPLQVVSTGLDSDAVITVHNAKGALLYSAAIPAAQSCVDVLLPIDVQGTYIYQIQSESKKFFGKFIIK